MKILEALNKVEKAENAILIIRQPTKKLWGYVIRFKGDPMLEILRINDKTETKHYTNTVKIGKNKYGIEDSFAIPASLTTMLIRQIRKLLEIEI